MSTGGGIRSLVQELAEITEQQVQAARTLDGPRVQDLDRRRADQLFELQLALQDGPVEPDNREHLRESLARLRAAEERLERIARTVLAALSGLRPADPVQTYARTGSMRG